MSLSPVASSVLTCQ